MPGYAHIFRLGTRKAAHGATVSEYQFTYNRAGHTWARTFDGQASLERFLRSNVGLTHARTEQALSELGRSGKITIAEAEIAENAAPALGLKQMPSDV
jgi:hypothetical protein